MTENDSPPAWAIVELMGHVKHAGRLTEEEKFGAKLGRLDIPQAEGDGFTTVYFGGGSVYRLTVVTEAVARQVARQTGSAPVSAWDFPRQLPSPATVSAGDDSPKPYELDEDDDDGYDGDEE